MKSGARPASRDPSRSASHQACRRPTGAATRAAATPDAGTGVAAGQRDHRSAHSGANASMAAFPPVPQPQHGTVTSALRAILRKGQVRPVIRAAEKRCRAPRRHSSGRCARPSDRSRHLGGVVHQVAGAPVLDDFGQRARRKRDHRRAAGHGFHADQGTRFGREAGRQQAARRRRAGGACGRADGSDEAGARPAFNARKQSRCGSSARARGSRTTSPATMRRTPARVRLPRRGGSPSRADPAERQTEAALA